MPKEDSSWKDYVIKVLGGIVGVVFLYGMGWLVSTVMSHEKNFDKISEMQAMDDRITCQWKHLGRAKNRIAEMHGVDPAPARCD